MLGVLPQASAEVGAAPSALSPPRGLLVAAKEGHPSLHLEGCGKSRAPWAELPCCRLGVGVRSWTPPAPTTGIWPLEHGLGSLPGLGPTRTSPCPCWCGAGQGESNPVGKQHRGWGAALVPLFANTDTEHGGTQAPLPHTQGSVCPTVLPSVCSPAPQRRGAQPLGAAAAVRPPRAQRAAGCAWASSCTALPGGGGSAHSPRSLQAPAPGLHRVLGAGSAPTPQPPVPGPGTEPEGLLVPSENLPLLRPWVRGFSPGVLFIATASVGRGRTPQDPGPAELPARGRDGRCPPPGTTLAMGTRGDGADVKLGAGSPPVPATGGCWAGEEVSPLLPRDPAAGGWVGGGGAARP